MIQEKRYRYIGRNGIITSPVLLNGIEHIPMTYLEAAPGFILTNDKKLVYAITVETAELNQWHEIVDNTK